MNPVMIDVTPSGLRSVSADALGGALSRALRWGGQQAQANGRYDADGLVGTVDLLDGYHRHVDGLALRELGQSWRPPPPLLDLAHRADAFPAGAGGFPRDFEFVRTQIFEEKREPLTGMMYFPVDSSVPLGARKHTARRSLGSGEAQLYRAGSEIPRARTTYVEEQFGVVYVVCAVDVQFFDALTTDWAGLQQYQRDLRLAVRLVEERLNRLVWSGDVGSQIAGVLSYPSLAKVVIATAFTDASTPEDIATELADFANTPIIESGGTFYPTELLVSPRIHAFLFSRKHSTSGGTDVSIGEYFLKGQAAGGSGIRSIKPAPELAGAGPGGEDCILAHRPELDTEGHVLIQPPTPLPVYQSGPLDQTTVVFAASGGMVMPDVGNCILGYVTVA